MDPTANFKEQLELAARILRGEPTPGDIDRLAELVEALDQWLQDGGSYPCQWLVAG